MQNRIDDLAKIAEAREDTTDYFRVMMVGDSTMEHQYGNICSFFGERKGRRFDPEVSGIQPASVCFPFESQFTVAVSPVVICRRPFAHSRRSIQYS